MTVLSIRDMLRSYAGRSTHVVALNVFALSIQTVFSRVKNNSFELCTASLYSQSTPISSPCATETSDHVGSLRACSLSDAAHGV